MKNPYMAIFRNTAFRNFWLGFVFSVMGDAVSRVALTWYVYETTQSARALGLLMFAYTAPVLIGGFVAGALLDRFNRRNLMIMDNTIRGIAMGLMPLLYAVGQLELWHIYVIVLVYGSFMMISLAGSPSLVPSLVPQEMLITANALETLGYTLSGIAGPLIAGILLNIIDAPYLVGLDALSYFFFAAALSTMKITPPPERRQAASSYQDAFRLLLRNPILLSTTLMFMIFNLGLGVMLVYLPIFADKQLNGGSGLYGFLLGMIAVGEVISALFSGAVRFRLPLGLLICLSQGFSGVALLILLPSMTVPMAVVSLMLFGAFSAPLTIWAQTLRMRVIPEALRGRTFSLLRTFMQATSPLGGIVGGVLLSILSLPIVIGFSALLIGFPGLVGYFVVELRAADPTSMREPAQG